MTINKRDARCRFGAFNLLISSPFASIGPSILKERHPLSLQSPNQNEGGETETASMTISTMAASTIKPSLLSQPFTSPQIHPSLTKTPLLQLQHPLSSPPHLLKIHSQKSHIANPQTQTKIHDDSHTDEDGIPIEHVKTLVKFKSRHNYIRVLQVSRKADHSLAGSRLLLLDAPGNIHSISYLFNSLTNAYFDVFATIPPIIPPGPIGIFGFGAGSAARILLEMYPQVVIHGWELDPSVISVGREYFGLEKLEKEYQDRLFIYIGNALNACVKDGFSGVLVDLYSKGCVIPQLQDPQTWEVLKECLRDGGRIMVNVGGSCVEPDDIRKDGKVIMEETLEAMNKVFPGEVFVLNLGSRKDDSTVAITGGLPDLVVWKKAVPKPLKFYVDMWKAYRV